MFGSNTIAKRVAAVIKERVRIAQERFDQSSAEIDHNCACQVTEIYAKRDAQKEQLADDLVRSVIG
jgi:queuine/archaeosine tRNA-ribosyltransferase